MSKNYVYTLIIVIASILYSTNLSAEEYGLKILDVDVTSSNCTDLSVINGVTGKISYVPESKQLILNNVTIESQKAVIGIWNISIEGLTVVVEGNCKITTVNDGIVFYRPSNIEGKGTLTIDSEKQCAIFMNSSALTISNCILNAKGKWGISGFEGTEEEKLTINNAHVKAQGDGTQGSICDIASLALVNCSITIPDGAAFNQKLKGVALKNNLVKQQIEITPETSHIESMATTDGTEIIAVYNTAGQKLPDMQSGLNIVKTANGITKKYWVK